MMLIHSKSISCLVATSPLAHWLHFATGLPRNMEEAPRDPDLHQILDDSAIALVSRWVSH
jgi:hypothetical protein